MAKKVQKRAKKLVDDLDKAVGKKAPRRIKRRMRKVRKAVARLVH